MAVRDSDAPARLPERVGIDLPRVLENPKFRDNIILASGDSIHIPEFNPIVLVQGAVNSPGAVAYTPGKNLDWYVDAAGGYTQAGDARHPYVTQPDGEREGVKRKAVFADRVPHPEAGSGGVRADADRARSRRATSTAILGTAAQLLGALVTIIVVAQRTEPRELDASRDPASAVRSAAKSGTRRTSSSRISSSGRPLPGALHQHVHHRAQARAAARRSSPAAPSGGRWGWRSPSRRTAPRTASRPAGCR